MVWCDSLRLIFPGYVAYACIDIQQMTSEEEEEEEDTSHIDTWWNAKVWVDFFRNLH